MHPDFDLITGLVAIDGDAKRSTPANSRSMFRASIAGYVKCKTQTCSAFSTSLKGLRALAFGTIPTEKQNITKHFQDGTEISLFRAGWVTLSGLTYFGLGSDDRTPTGSLGSIIRRVVASTECR